MVFKVKMFLRDMVLGCVSFYYQRILGMKLGKSVRISLKARIDKTYPQGIKIGDGTYIAFDAVVLTHDFCRSMHVNTIIGKNCFIGASSIIMPGVKVGDSVIVGAGSVVLNDVPSNVIVAGNPARIIREGIITSKYGVIVD